MLQQHTEPKIEFKFKEFNNFNVKQINKEAIAWRLYFIHDAKYYLKAYASARSSHTYGLYDEFYGHRKKKNSSSADPAIFSVFLM